MRSYHTKCTKKCGLRTNCNAVLKELGRKNLNWVVAQSSHLTQGTPEGTYMDEGKEGSAKARAERLEDIHARWTKGGIGGHTAAFGCGG
jgi:hypothetical protein